jgi:hypothetical protein
LAPDVLVGRPRAVHGHHVAAAGSMVGAGSETGVVVLGVVYDIIHALGYQIARAEYIVARKTGVPAFKITIGNEVIAQVHGPGSEHISGVSSDGNGGVQGVGALQTDQRRPGKIEIVSANRAVQLGGRWRRTEPNVIPGIDGDGALRREGSGGKKNSSNTEQVKTAHKQSVEYFEQTGGRGRQR